MTLLAGVLAVSCTPPRGEGATRAPPSAAIAADGAVPANAPSAVSPAAASGPDAAAAAPLSPPLEADGDDDAPPPAAFALPREGHFERVGRAPTSLRRICDLTPFAGALYAAHANDPLNTDGAVVSRYAPGDERAFRMAFDWNRPGQPTKGGGGGQGFLRVHVFAGRLVVPDADPPYAGFGLADHATEGYVFMSSSDGAFARAVGSGLRPPAAPTPEGRAGAAVLPRAYHVIDATRFRGHLYAATGSVAPGARGWSGPAPGALHVASDDLARWSYAVGYPDPPRADGVWRLTFLVRYRDRLYAGIQNNEGIEPNDYVVFAPPPLQPSIAQADVHGVRATPGGGALTLRWFADRGSLYWVAFEPRRGVRLRVTDDGETWRELALPAGAGSPSDLARVGDDLVVLAEHGLYRLGADGFAPIALLAPRDKSFLVDDVFCAAPLAAFDGALYAGGQRDGALYRLVDGPAPSPHGP